MRATIQFWKLFPILLSGVLAIPTAVPTASISVDASVMSGSPAIAGTNVQFTLDANNEGPDDAQNVTLTFATPNNTTFVSLAAPNGWSCQTPPMGGTGTITCTTPTLAAGTDVHFFTVATPSSTPRGTVLSFSATITSTTADPSANDNTVTLTVPVDWVSAIALSKNAPVSANAGTPFTYAININDNGPSSAGDLTFTDVLPAPLRFTSINAPGWSCTTPTVGTNGTVTCTIGEIPVGLTAITMQVTTPSSTAPTSVTNNISLTSTTDSRSPETASATTSITTSADLAIAKSSAPPAVAAGQPLSYTIQVTNAGPSDATSVVMTDPLPAAFQFTSVSAPGWSCSGTTTIQCTMLSLALSATSTITINGTIAASTPASQISNTATITSSTSDPTSTNNGATATTSVSSPAIVAAVKSLTSNQPLFETQPVAYTIVLTNSGAATQSDNPGNEMTDVLPSSLTLVGASASSGTAVANSGTNTVTWNGSIAKNGSVTITINATIKSGTAGTPISNQASIAFDADGNGTNESAAASNTVTFTPAAASAIPALSTYGLIALAASLALLAMYKMCG